MTVEVEFFATLRLKLPKATYRLEMPDGSTVGDLMGALVQVVGEDFRSELFRGMRFSPEQLSL
ncbi:hypothetical protein HPY42_01260 [Coprothermobacteraceae bacterium]|nr:hypothetical protein [Coprothermobacteraceae bacterium]